MQLAYNISNLFLFFLFYSFFGWLMEVILTFFKSHKYIDRGFLIGPYCPIYGMGVLAITFMLRNYTDNILVLFVLSSVICMVLEYITSYLMEKLFHARWWDYTDEKFNINGRICLETTIPFGLGATLVMKVSNPAVYKVLGSIPNNTLIIIASILMVLFLIDIIVSTVVVNKLKSIEFKPYKDNTEEITIKIREFLRGYSALTKRLYFAFPNLRASFKNTKDKIDDMLQKNKLRQNELKQEMKEQKEQYKKIKKGEND